MSPKLRELKFLFGILWLTGWGNGILILGQDQRQMQNSEYIYHDHHYLSNNNEKWAEYQQFKKHVDLLPCLLEGSICYLFGNIKKLI